MKKKKEKKIIGWREWVDLPELEIKNIKAKIDTGARTSAIHAYDLEIYTRAGKDYVRFKVHTQQRSTKKVATCKAKIFEYRKVKSSNGKSELRPVIRTEIQLLGDSWPIELTLTNRDEMGFRMLLGREAFKKKFLVDVGTSYRNGKPLRKKTKKKK